jgi:iron-sulfur cluster assembly protein
MFQVTATAAEQIKSAAEAQDDEPLLRVAAKIDDDGGLVYGMGFDEERENDLVIECQGISVLISPRSQELLDEATLDFVELHPGEFQFVFINPKEGSCSGNTGNAGGPSGCGTCGGGCA